VPLGSRPDSCYFGRFRVFGIVRACSCVYIKEEFISDDLEEFLYTEAMKTFTKDISYENTFIIHRASPAIPASTAWYLAAIAESKGKQELFKRQSPQKLKALREHALIQSAVSSNRIEGVTIDASASLR